MKNLSADQNSVIDGEIIGRELSWFYLVHICPPNRFLHAWNNIETVIFDFFEWFFIK